MGEGTGPASQWPRIKARGDPSGCEQAAVSGRRQCLGSRCVISSENDPSGGWCGEGGVTRAKPSIQTRDRKLGRVVGRLPPYPACQPCTWQIPDLT